METCGNTVPKVLSLTCSFFVLSFISLFMMSYEPWLGGAELKVGICWDLKHIHSGAPMGVSHHICSTFSHFALGDGESHRNESPPRFRRAIPSPPTLTSTLVYLGGPFLSFQQALLVMSAEDCAFGQGLSNWETDGDEITDR